MSTAGRRRAWKLTAALIGSVVLLTAWFVIFQVFTLSSFSMAPTLLPGDVVLIDRLVYRLRPPRRGDLIAFYFPQARDREFVKRVVGLPGDVVAEERGRFRVNGIALRDTWPEVGADTDASGSQAGVWRVPADHVYVLGDNRGTSLDSRYWGTVDEKNVIGQAMVICWSGGHYWWDIRWDRIGHWLE